MEEYLVPFLLTLIAGLCTGVGSILAFLYKGDQKKFLSVGLGFSAGVMIYVSMIEIFQKAFASLSAEYGEKQGMLWTMCGFFGGMFLIALIDLLVPKGKNPHELEELELDAKGHQEKSELFRTGIFTALAIAIHNFPEGLATFVSAVHEPDLAIPIVVAIAIHNIPEGIAVSVPIFSATGNRKKALGYSFASGLAEPIGAVIGYTLLLPYMNDQVYGLLFSSVAGIMVFISLDELLPAAEKYGEHHLSIYGMFAGMLLMGISLWMFL
ncbi:MAG: zinc transporter ZupT [Eubacteriales bacterium]